MKAGVVSEQQVKAAFLFNFIRFVDWPGGTFHDKGAPIVVGVSGNDPLSKEVEECLRDKSVNGRKLSFKPINWPDEISGVHILMVCASEAKSVSAVLAKVKGAPVLTVGETERFAEQGGVINFYISENKVRFEINIDAAQRARLKISSQLLTLAKIVKEDARAERM
jgi:hypothetical protein